MNRLFRDIYAPFLLNPKTKLYVLGLYCAYLFVAIYGFTQIQEGLNPKNLVRSNFYLSDFYELIDQTFWQEGKVMADLFFHYFAVFAKTSKSTKNFFRVLCFCSKQQSAQFFP